MNCKPGDLATVLATQARGQLVEVLYEAPVGQHNLPDGYPAITLAVGEWVCRLVGWQYPAPLENGDTRMASFGVIADRDLRPLPGQRTERVREWVA